VARNRKTSAATADAAPTKNRGGRPKRERSDPGLAAAIEAAGGIGILAAIAGVTTGAVSIWRRVPKKAVAAISDRLQIPASTLRPDLYGQPPQDNTAF